MADELRALTRLAFDELGLGTGGIGKIHQAIADRAFAGPSPAKLLHDGISGAVYASVAGAASLAGRAAAVAVRDRPVSTTPRGAAVLGVLNGLRGDVLEREGSELAVPMSLRGRRRPHAADRGVRARAVRDRVRLGLRRRAALRRPARGRPRLHPGLCALQQRPPHLRERPLAGRSCSTTLVAGWPVPVEQIVLVGHSMGGLVARSACHAGGDWTGHVTHVVSLGSPHTGAPLESAVHYAAAALGAVPETRPLSRFLRRRSAGIRDMRQRLAGRRGLARPRPRGPARGRLPRGAAARRRDALLRGGDRDRPGRPPGRAAARRLARARAQRIATVRRRRCTSAPRTTSRCSTTRSCTGGSASGCSSSTRLASHSVAGSCSGFISTLRRIRAPSASATSPGAGAGGRRRRRAC